jgi:hypothetical protein
MDRDPPQLDETKSDSAPFGDASAIEAGSEPDTNPADAEASQVSWSALGSIAVAGIGLLGSAVRAYDDLANYRGLTWALVTERAAQLAAECVRRSGEHDNLARRWRWVAQPLAWTTAVLAAVSGLTIVSQDPAVLGLALATALCCPEAG